MRGWGGLEELARGRFGNRSRRSRVGMTRQRSEFCGTFTRVGARGKPDDQYGDRNGDEENDHFGRQAPGEAGLRTWKMRPEKLTEATQYRFLSAK